MAKWALIVLMAACLPAFASEPGQPLDCSDWVFLEPGLSCEVIDAPAAGFFFTRTGVNLSVDNTGRMFRIADVASSPQAPNAWEHSLAGITIQGFGESGAETVAQILDRVGVGGYCDHIRPIRPKCERDSWQDCIQWTTGRTMLFDAVGGRLLIPVDIYCSHCSEMGQTCPYYGREAQVIAIGGFAPLLEIFQTYTPTLGSLSFRVPPIPEGFPTADRFDTYYGDLATVGDWSRAQPLECEYPATAPSVGNYLTVDDPLPDPAPGQGRYYVTAVNYQGQTRYGRKSIGGVLSGRDPAMLPACAP